MLELKTIEEVKLNSKLLNLLNLRTFIISFIIKTMFF